MKKCCKCGESLVSGHILCSACKDDFALPLRSYIAQLAEEIVLGYMGMCDLCIRKQCDSQQSGLTCLKGIDAFLQSRIPEYEKNLREEEKHDGQQSSE